MRAVIQRVSSAQVDIEGEAPAVINQGLLVFLGIETNDNLEDVLWLSKKIASLRIFSDENRLMNLSLSEIKGELLLISQFTLHASTKKGRRPSYIRAARPEQAEPLYRQMQLALQKELNTDIKTGIFGANMKVTLTNEGPVTILIDTKAKE